MSNVLHIIGATTSVNASTTTYITSVTGSANSGTEGRNAIDVRTAGTASLLFCNVSANDRAASTLKQRINAGNGNQSVAITGSTTGQFEDSTNNDSWDATEEVALQIVTGAGGTAFVMEGVSLVFAAASGTVAYIGGSASAGIFGTTSFYESLVITNGDGNPGPTEAAQQNTIAISATLQNAFGFMGTNSKNQTTDVSTRINGVTGNCLLSWASATTGEDEDTSGTDSVVDGDEVGWFINLNAGSGTLVLDNIKVEVSATDAFPLFASQNPATTTTQNSALTRYVFPAGQLSANFDDTEADKQVKTNVAFTWSDLYGYVHAYSLNSGNYVVRSRVNGGNGNMVITFTGTGQQSDASNTDTVADDDEINFSSVTGGTSGSIQLRQLSTLATVSAGGGGARSTKNTRATRLGMELGMNIWMQ